MRFLVTVLLALWSVAAAAEAMRFQRYSVEEGLSQAIVQAVAQDLQGFVWIGTQQGLNRFDGHEFRQYFHDPGNPRTLSHDWVWALLPAAGGTLWIGTEAGLDALHPSGTIERIDLGREVEQVRALAADERGSLWVGLDGGGLVHFQPESRVVTRYQHDPARADSLSSDRVKAVLVDPSGYVWVGTEGGGLNRFDPVRASFRRISLDGPGTGHVRSLAADPDGGVWVGSYEAGLYHVDGAGVQTGHRGGGPDGLSSGSIRVLKVDRAGALWVGTDSHGLNVLTPGQTRIRRVRHDPGDIRSLPGDHIGAVYQDRGGVIWVGTYHGLATWNPMSAAFNAVSGKVLGNGWVASFADHDDGHVWVGTAGGGVSLVAADGTVRRVITSADGLADDRAMALASDPDGSLWVGTRAGGLNHVAAHGAVHVYRHDAADPESLPADGVTSLLRDGAGTLWVGTYGGGLGVLDRAAGTFRRHRAGAADGLCSDRVLSLFEDRTGTLWAGTHGGGLCRLDRATGRFTTYRHDPGDPESLSSDNAWTVHEDPDGNLWVGTADAGLNVWRSADRVAGRARFERIGVPEGLVSPIVYGLQSDAMGRLWLSSNRGLTRLDVGTGQLHHYSVTDGLQSNEFNFGAAHRSRSGRLYFGGNDGFNAFAPEQIGVNAHAPPVALTRFERLNRAVQLDALRDAEGRVILRHDDDLITFEYAALDFTAPRENAYWHRLVGFDETWVADGRTRRATYTNLAPGDYLFEARAANNDGVLSTRNLSIPLRVLPPPWATWWAWTAYSVAALALLALGYRSYARRLAVAHQIHETNLTLRNEIAERQAKEAALAREQQKAQRYLDVVEVIILALDAAGRVTMINQKGLRVFGCREADIVGENFFDRFVPAEARQPLRERLANVDQYAYSESPVKPADGPERMVAWHAIELPAGTDEDSRLLMSGTDVTQMRNLERQLREAQKMEALGTMAGGVAHDFNNILSSILGYAQLSLGEVPAGGKVADYLRKLEASVDRARDLIHGILTFGRATAQAPQPVKIEAVVAEAMQLVEPVLSPRIDVLVDAHPDCGAVMADPSQLMQVILNLCANAGQAMEESGGTLAIEVRPWEVDVEEARSSGTLGPGPHVLLVVADSGVGMDDYTLERIFDPFFTTRRREQGTGLGLAVVHGIVSQLKGSIRVTSELGRGSRFEIKIPCCEEVPAVRAEPVAVTDPPRGEETILFIDDEQPVVAIAFEALSRLGYEVLTAEDGARGLELYRRHGHAIDLVITDQTMPGMLGHELAERLRELRPELPVILMSGAHMPDTDAVTGVLHKPFTLQELSRLVRRVMDGASVAD